ncbi:MAG TPA: cupin domain-containing protein [Allosphingosinicella sp.]|nr:cupin domain-containing protein [Allosphingosinicella sp.]
MTAFKAAIGAVRAGTRRHYSFSTAPMRREVAHDGEGELETARVESSPDGLEFIDLTSIPPGGTVGIHRHSPDNEEIYVIVSGEGAMTVEKETFSVGPGDVIVNDPGGEHGLRNVGTEELRMVVVQKSPMEPGR